MLVHHRDCPGDSAGAPPVHGFRLTRTCLKTDAAILAVCFVCYLLARCVLMPSLDGGFFPSILRSHLADFVGGVAFMAYTNLLFDLFKPNRRIRSILVIAPYIFACGLFWEFVAPFIVKPSTSDWWDVLAYVLGGALYWGIARVTEHANVE